MASGAKAPAASAAGAANRRFVFMMVAPHEEIIDGSLREVRASNSDEAQAQADGSWLVRDAGAIAKLVGERIGGLGHMQRFLPLVPDTEIPDEILRNERVIGVEVA